jgi:transglutaminase-like putative cysteine protease
MRSRSFSCSALFARFVLSLAFLLPAAAALAQFQDPTKEELSMTADPKAPGAAAVYLNLEQKTDDTLHYRSVYARIKVLTEKGMDLATVEVPYASGEQKVTGIKARTIHPDGTVVQLEGTPEDLLAKKAGDVKVGKRVFNLPSVEVGSILEYQYDVRYDDNWVFSPYWEIQQRYFVHKAHYYFVPSKSFLKGPQNATGRYVVDEDGNPANTLIWWQQLPTGGQIVQDSIGRFTLDLADVPAIPDEEYMPPIDAFLYQVKFYYKGPYNATDYWVQKAKKWSKDVDHFAEPTKGIQAAVTGIVQPGDSDLVKAQKLYEAVQGLENTDYTRAKGAAERKALGLKQIKRAEDTWAQKSGSKQDIALLYLAMLRAAGLTAWDMKVVNRNRNLFQFGYLDFGQLDDNLVILATGGKEYVLDPGEKMCPFQTVSWIHSGATGVRQSPDGGALGTTPEQLYTANSTTRIGDVTLDASGAISGSFRIIMAGHAALHWRQVALESDTGEVKKEFDSELEAIAPEGVSLQIDHFLGLDDPNVNLMAMVKVSGTLGTPAGRRLLVPGFFFESRGQTPFVNQAQRLEPIDMGYGARIVEQVTYHLPAGMTVEGALQDAKIAWLPNAQLTTKTVQAPGQVTVARALLRAFTFLKPDQYQDLRGFYQKVAANDQQQMVLTTAAKGN